MIFILRVYDAGANSIESRVTTRTRQRNHPSRSRFRFRFRCLLHMESELQIRAQQSRVLPSMKFRIHSQSSRPVFASDVFFAFAYASLIIEKESLPLTFAVATSGILYLASNSACPPFSGGSWMLLMENISQREENSVRCRRCGSYKQYGNKDGVAYGIIMVIINKDSRQLLSLLTPRNARTFRSLFTFLSNK